MATVTQIGALTDFTAGTTIVSSEVDTNFSAIRTQFNNLVSGNNQIDVDTIRENTSATGVTIDGVLLKDNGITATGGGSLTGTWSNLGTVTTVDINGGTIGGVTLDGTISGTPTWASSQAITLSTASQPNVTSLGTLTSLAVSGTVNFGNSLATDATSGFLYIPRCAGVPTGTPALGVGAAVFNTTNNQLRIWNGSDWVFTNMSA